MSTLNSVGDEFQKEESMAPLFLFLASSYNVELVYVILKGITQFGYYTCDNQNEAVRAKIKKLDINMNKRNDEATLKMDKIKVKDY